MKHDNRLFGAARVAIATAAAALALGIGLASPTAVPSAEADGVLPVFDFAGEITTPATMIYNPTGEFIFPSILHASEYFDAPLGEWYLYYAPHENPGGISLMYADSLDGPWTEYAANPLIANQWAPHYSVNHVSSPDAIWNHEADKLFLYFHGGNDQTRFASSADGITFSYEQTAVDNADGGTGITETSYARVFPHPDATSMYNYGMFYMDNTSANQRRIRVAESVDGREWVVRPDPIVTSGSLEGGNVSGANLWEWQGQLYVIYHGSTGKIFARTIDETLSTTGPTVLLHKASGIGEDTGRTASPEIVSFGGTTYLFYEAGARLDATVAYAVAPFELNVASTAQSACVDGVASITVDAVNQSGVRVDIRLTTSYGDKKYVGIASGASAHWTFSTGVASIPSGEALVAAFVRIDGVAHYEQVPTGYGAITC